MSKAKKVRLFFIAAGVWLAVLLFAMIYSGMIVLDHSVSIGSEYDSVTWQGDKYVRYAADFDLSKRVAKTTDGYNVYAIEGDPEHNFIFVGVLGDGIGFYVKEDYDIPDSGEITEVVWDGVSISDGEFCDAIEKIRAFAKTDYKFKTDKLERMSIEDGDKMEELTIRYGDYPVADGDRYIGKLDGEWTFTMNIDYTGEKDGGYTVGCYRIPAEYHPVLEKHLSKYL